jgi:HK97 gp10 family phage protein
MADFNISKVFKELDGLDKALRNKIIRQSQRAGAKILASEIKSEAPVDSGRTKRSVKVKSGKRRKNTISTNVEISGGHDEPFIGFVEFGTKDQAPNPFIRRSVLAKRDEVVEVVREGILNGIKGALK